MKPMKAIEFIACKMNDISNAKWTFLDEPTPDNRLYSDVVCRDAMREIEGCLALFPDQDIQLCFDYSEQKDFKRKLVFSGTVELHDGDITHTGMFDLSFYASLMGVDIDIDPSEEWTDELDASDVWRRIEEGARSWAEIVVHVVDNEVVEEGELVGAGIER